MRAGSTSRRRVYAVALLLGGAVLLVRAITLFSQGAIARWTPWVGFSLWVETTVIVIALTTLVLWLVDPSDRRTTAALVVTTVLVLVHAFRVAVFALGRTGPWVDFDVRPEFRADHGALWTWGEVWFASGAALVSLVVTMVVWRHRRAGSRAA